MFVQLSEAAVQMEVLQLLFPSVCRLIAQTGRRGLLTVAVACLHVCGPERCADGVREREEDAGDGDHLKKDGRDTEAVRV